MIKEKIHNKQAQKDVQDLLQEEKIDEMFRYLELYKNSLSEDADVVRQINRCPKLQIKTDFLEPAIT